MAVSANDNPASGGAELLPTTVDTAIDAVSEPVFSNYSEPVRRTVSWLAIVGACVLSVVFATPLILALWRQQSWMIDTIKAHFAAIVGLPMAALVAFILVIILEAKFDSIDMEFRGIAHFRGASGPIVLWVLCFLAITAAIKLLW